MESQSNPHKRQKLGFENYSDSKVLSDITIRYGASGERTFEGHRLLLSAKSYWFKAAFTGQFAESSAKEITLKEDDPDALRAMLNYAYDEKSVPWPDDSLAGTTFDIHHILDLYRVGDKYDFPSFRLQLIFRLMTALRRWFSRPSEPSIGYAAESEEFCEIIRKVYDIVGSEHQEDQDLVETFLQAIDEHPSARILNNTGGKQGIIVKASREVAEFGRDIFLHLMYIVGTEDHKDGTVSTTELCTGIKVRGLLRDLLKNR
ncbi:hypothetical protein J4E93_008853 [Alternaria ventricosa]|uniref:uncharacterized protein n=1 Tax=Alternaria ventricosa TaxID=1187951 RepID=UPI0020C33C5E|nr:uncharacterized protein J4E93_008853 [Alternaria ventricosa]KAI4640053.1 hypothetical protein J4E93_008853 [Alternaria ventricosa]